VSKVSTVFQVSIYGLAIIASLMLAAAEGTVFPQMLTVPLAVAALILTERTRTVALPVLWANALGLLAFVAAGWEFFDENIEGRILSGAHLLVYLSWIVLFQEKHVVQYWWMCALGVLQVAVGSVLTNDETYGAMLVGYMVWSIWTLSVFGLHLAQQQFGTTAGTGTNLLGPQSRGGAAGGPGARQRPGAQLSAALAVRRASVARGSVQHDPNERWFGPQFLFTNVSTALLAMVVSSCFFLLIPRLWAGKNEWESGRSDLRPRAMSGFTSQVRLGDFGDVLESTAKVLEVRLFDNDTGRELNVEQYCESLGQPEPLFRGTAMAEYNFGTWSGTDLGSGILIDLPVEPPAGSVRQEIHMEPIGTDLLFAIHPVRAARLAGQSDEPEIQYANGVLHRPSRIAPHRPVAYSVYSPRGPAAREIIGREHSLFGPFVGLRSQWLSYLRTKPGPSLSRLTELARRVSGYDDLNRPSAEVLAERLRDHLRNSGEYSYSLDTSIIDKSIDPVEDFLFNRKKGHCEYFATALALMLRAVDIPSRLVSGFKGGTPNAISGYYEVEQRHAHAWVEAHVGNRWVTLDATPEARAESVASFAPSMRTAHDLASFVKGTWSRYVVNMDISQQNNSFYDPIKQWWNSSTGGRAQITALWNEFVQFISNPRRWFSFTGAGITFLLLVLLASLFHLGRRFPALWQLLRRGRQSARRVRIAFYERFESLCARLGLSREDFQTQGEFADRVARALHALPANGDLEEIPAQVVQSFYRVRFGTEELEADEAALLDRQLARLEEAIARSNGLR